jgi:hypothetical protein
MAIRLHALDHVRLDLEPHDLHGRLRARPLELVAAATAEALASCATLLHQAGITPLMLPTIAAAASTGDEFGSVTLQWRGRDDATGWPAMTAHLVVSPDGDGSRLTLVTTRVPAPALTSTRLGALHRQRLARLLVGAFLRRLGTHVRTDVRRPSRTPELTR